MLDKIFQPELFIGKFRFEEDRMQNDILERSILNFMKKQEIIITQENGIIKTKFFSKGENSMMIDIR